MDHEPRIDPRLATLQPHSWPGLPGERECDLGRGHDASHNHIDRNKLLCRLRPSLLLPPSRSLSLTLPPARSRVYQIDSNFNLNGTEQ